MWALSSCPSFFKREQVVEEKVPRCPRRRRPTRSWSATWPWRAKQVRRQLAVKAIECGGGNDEQENDIPVLSGSAWPPGFRRPGTLRSFMSSEHLTVFTNQDIWNKEPQPCFQRQLLVLSSFQPNRQEFLVFGNIISGKECRSRTACGTRKNHPGHGLRQGADHPRQVAEIRHRLRLDFSAGPFFYFFLSNRYTHVGGKYKPEVEDASILHRVAIRPVRDRPPAAAGPQEIPALRRRQPRVAFFHALQQP